MLRPDEKPLTWWERRVRAPGIPLIEWAAFPFIFLILLNFAADVDLFLNCVGSDPTNWRMRHMTGVWRFVVGAICSPLYFTEGIEKWWKLVLLLLSIGWTVYFGLLARARARYRAEQDEADVRTHP